MKRFVLLLITFIVITFGSKAYAADEEPVIIDLNALKQTNCTLSMINNFVSDTFMMYDYTKDADTCLLKCEAFAEESLASMIGSVEKLEWTCRFDKKPFYQFDMIHKIRIDQ